MTFVIKDMELNSSGDIGELPMNYLSFPVANIMVSQNQQPTQLPQLVHVHFDWILLVVLIIILVVNLVGNISVIYFICGQSKARTAQNISLVSISASVIMLGTFVIPTQLVISTYQAEYYHQDPSAFLCKLQAHAWYWCKTVIIYSTCALISDRYSRVIRPTKNHILSGRYMFFLSFLWFFGAAYNIWEVVIKVPMFVSIADSTGQNATIKLCSTAAQFHKLRHGLLYLDYLVIYIVPLSISLFMFGRMICHLCRKSDVRYKPTSKRRLLLTIGLLFMFYACQLPLEIVDVITFFNQSITYNIIIAKRTAEVLSLSQGVLHVIVYWMFSSEFHSVVRAKWMSIVGKRHGQNGSRNAVDRSSIPQILVCNGDIDNSRRTNMEMRVVRILE